MGKYDRVLLRMEKSQGEIYQYQDDEKGAFWKWTGWDDSFSRARL